MRHPTSSRRIPTNFMGSIRRTREVEFIRYDVFTDYSSLDKSRDIIKGDDQDEGSWPIECG